MWTSRHAEDPHIRWHSGGAAASFRIHVVRETVAVDDGGLGSNHLVQERILWPSCPRETKLKAFEKLPELLDRIIEEAERLARTSEATRVKVEEMIGEDEPVEVRTAPRVGLRERGGVESPARRRHPQVSSL